MNDLELIMEYEVDFKIYFNIPVSETITYLYNFDSEIVVDTDIKTYRFNLIETDKWKAENEYDKI